MKTRQEIEKRATELRDGKRTDTHYGDMIDVAVRMLEWVLSDDPDPSAEEVRAINENANTD
jgi:hypothetical protein